MADRYSFSLTTFSPSGKLVQIEYALNAVNNGVTAIGIKASNGVVLATEKKATSPLVDPKLRASNKIVRLTPNIGMVYSGMGPDYQVLTEHTQKGSHSKYKLIYNEYPPVEILVEEAARTMQEATQQAGTRPYGVSLLIAGWDEQGGKRGKTGPSLYQVDPSGTYFPWKATAIGKGATSAKTFLEKRYTDNLGLEDAIHIALLTLKEAIEGEMNGDTIELAIVGDPRPELLGYEGVDGAIGPRFRTLSRTEVEDYLSSL